MTSAATSVLRPSGWRRAGWWLGALLAIAGAVWITGGVVDRWDLRFGGAQAGRGRGSRSAETWAVERPWLWLPFVVAAVWIAVHNIGLARSTSVVDDTGITLRSAGRAERRIPWEMVADLRTWHTDATLSQSGSSGIELLTDSGEVVDLPGTAGPGRDPALFSWSTGDVRDDLVQRWERAGGVARGTWPLAVPRPWWRSRALLSVAAVILVVASIV